MDFRMDFDNSAHDEILGVDLWSFCPHKALSDLLSFELASKLRAFVYSVDGQTLCIVMQNPFDEKAKQVLLHKFSHLCKKIIIAKESGSHFAWILQALQFVERFYISKDISQMLDFVLQEGIRFQASDIHIETKPDFASIRFRIDGYLREIGRIYLEDFTQLASKIKLESKLDITESRLPQDGRYNRNFNGIDYDFRISCVPLFGGESIVIRILYKHNKTITLQSLGINPHILEQLKIAIQKKNGLILITGPTGSGKSTTIYALLEELKSLQKKIITLEDPIEYQIKLATQIQINPDIGFSFVEALRSVLRQDPDIIMVGEIRDRQTLDLALNASLTGHLVIASLHSNDCISTLDRLFEMGAQHSIIATSLLCVVAQRLVGRLCPHCKVAFEGGFVAKGCESCNGIGIVGREVVCECMFIDKQMRDLIIEHKSIRAHTANIATLKDDAKLKKDIIDYKEIEQLE